ncbi:CLUMA_CG006476, isoform A [Clunio marinus]|uniref:Facilitated trehalose transporter Tret1 n=1 Tax=Clunio marinus TaxID=568069 RepID=A0A1J1I0N1_9DIPT|nr:CLUMA_CG006476, isoform A [Clunio marinus]
MEEPVKIQKTIKWPQIVAALSAAGGAFAVGAAIGWPAPAGPRLVGGEEDYFSIGQSAFDWTSSILNVGAAISCLPIGYLMKKFGRKWAMIGLTLPFVVGWALVIWAQNFAMLFIGRLLIGLAGGAFCVSSPQYSSETAEKEIRGIVGTFCVLLIHLGVLYAYVVGAFVSVFWLSIICALLPILFFATFIFMPESPVYLITEKREDDAIKSYKWLRGSSYDPLHEITELKDELEENEKNKVSYSEVFARKSTRRALVIGFGLLFFQQFSGINAVIFNSTKIFAAANTDIDPDYQTIIIGSVLVGATFLGSVLVDKFGRKILLVMSSVVMSITLITFGLYFYLLDIESSAVDSLSWLPLTSLCLFLVFYSIGYGPLPWLILSEVYSKDCNTIASPITGTFSWSLAFLITATFNSVSDGIGLGATFWIFAGISIIGILFSYFIVIETKAKTMADIQRILNGEKVM